LKKYENDVENIQMHFEKEWGMKVNILDIKTALSMINSADLLEK
jgi:hypothetical protein